MSSAFAARFRERYAALRFLLGIALEMSAGILSSQLAAKDYSTAVSREMAITAGQLSEPVLNAGIDNPLVQGADRFSTTRDFMAMRRIGVMQEFTRTDERRSRAAMKSTCACRRNWKPIRSGCRRN